MIAALRRLHPRPFTINGTTMLLWHSFAKVHTGCGFSYVGDLVMARPPRSLDEVTRSIEQTLIPQRERDPLERSVPMERSVVTPTSDTAEQTTTHWPATDATRPLSEVYNNAATEIQGTGEAVVQMANEIATETRALADLLRKHGASIAERIEEFTSMTKRVAEAVQKGRGEMSSGQTNGTPPTQGLE
jgi:hypothetical protein